MYVRKGVVDVNVEELSAFLDIPIYYEIEGSCLKDDIDLYMVRRELTEGYKINWLGEGKLTFSTLLLKYFGLYEISCTSWMRTANV